MLLKLVGGALLAAATASPLAFFAPASSQKNDYNLSYDAKETMLVVAVSEADFRDAKIHTAEKRGGSWGPIARISFSDARYRDSDPWLTPDGRTLYFISDRPAPGRGDRKDLDIWLSRRTSAGWSAPEHLGEAVNSEGEELGPEMHQGILYFSSTRKGGKGGLDIYSAKAGARGFEAPVPVEGPFNTAESESDFTLSPDGRLAAFWRLVSGQGVIHVARLKGGRWTNPIPLSKEINIGAFNFTPSFSNDGRMLWFASNPEREGQAKGMADIYAVKLPPVP